jgi:hypothetical protein
VTVRADETPPPSGVEKERSTAPRPPAYLFHHDHPPVVVLAVLGAVLLAAIACDVVVQSQLRHDQHSLAVAEHRLDQTRSSERAITAALASTTTARDARRQATAQDSAELAAARNRLSAASQTISLQTLDIAALGNCLSGVLSAANSVATASLPAAVLSLTSVSSVCLSLDGSGGGLAYPFDFPDPFVLPVGSLYYAFATNSAAGNIQIIQSTDLTHWTTVGDALPHLAPWAKPGATWAPSVLQRGSTFVLYYSAIYGPSNEQCISSAVATDPQGPYVDDSQWPIVCQLAAGGSIDPTPFVDSDGTPYLVWKSQGANGQPATLWSQQLQPDGTALVGTAPAPLLVPTRTWQHGYVEGPAMIDSGGKYLLFYSGSDWKTVSYAIGYATCAGPLGPCTDQSSQPLLGAQSGFSGPGGPSLFTDSQGNLWMAFAAWLPGEVGFPHSRPLFLRRITVTDGVPRVDP